MYKRPDYLQEGDTVVVIAPAGKIKEEGLDQAIAELKDWGLEVVIGNHALDGHNYFSASDQYRLADLQNAIDSLEYKAIFCARGGYGLTRIIDQVDFCSFATFPKWIIGFSDVTSLHLALSRHKTESIHSVMPTGFVSANPISVEYLRKVLFGEKIIIESKPNKYSRCGNAEALIIGGNLSLLSASIGTKDELKTTGKILFIEEIDEYLYKIDRMLGQLNRSGKLSNLKGLVIGHMTGIKDTTVPFGVKIEQMILEHVSLYDYPVLFDVPVGHEPINFPILQEGMYQLEVSKEGGTLRMK